MDGLKIVTASHVFMLDSTGAVLNRSDEQRYEGDVQTVIFSISEFQSFMEAFLKELIPAPLLPTAQAMFRSKMEGYVK